MDIAMLCGRRSKWCTALILAGLLTACGDSMAVPSDAAMDASVMDAAVIADGALGMDATSMSDTGLVDAATDTGTDAETVLPGTAVATYGCACDGVTNDSACLQDALDDWAAWDNRTLEWPSGVTCIAANLLWAAPTGTEDARYVLAGHGATLRAPDGHPVRATSPWDPILRINGGAFYSLDDLDFDGNRDSRTPIESPSHSLLIMSGRDVVIRGMDSIDAVSDGLYIAALDGNDLASRPQNIQVRDSVIRRSYRNNISVINCLNCEITGDGNGVDASCQLTDAQGTPPQAGIDFEPNVGNAVPAIDTVRVEGCHIAGNYGTGILLHTAAHPTGAVIRGNTMEGDRRTFRATCGAAMHMGFDDALVEDNVFQNYDIDPMCRAMFDWGAGADPQTTVFRNNRIEHVRFVTGSTQIFRIHGVNLGGHTITGNTLVDIGAGPDGDWCLDQTVAGNEIRDNTVDGTVQAPNPGCP